MRNLLIFSCLFTSVVCFGQTSTPDSLSLPSESIILAKEDYEEILQRNFDFGLLGYPSPYQTLTVAPLSLSNPFMSGMFCKMEYKLESKSKLSPRFRLGSQNYTDWMEGKKEIYTRYWK